MTPRGALDMHAHFALNRQKDRQMTSLIIRDPTAFGKGLPVPRARFDSKNGTLPVDGEEQPTGRDGMQAFLLPSETKGAIAEWAKNDTGDPVLEFDDDSKFLRDGFEFPYPLDEGKCPYHEMPMIIDGIGLVKFSGTSWASWNAIKKACAAYWSNGCSVFAKCWADITKLEKSKHKNFGLTFRPIEWVPVEKFAQFAPGAAALKAACAPALAEPVAQISASEIIKDEIPDHPAPKLDPRDAGKVRAKKTPKAEKPFDDSLPESW
jgi:hypothetical protein